MHLLAVATYKTALVERKRKSGDDVTVKNIPTDLAFGRVYFLIILLAIVLVVLDEETSCLQAALTFYGINYSHNSTTLPEHRKQSLWKYFSLAFRTFPLHRFLQASQNTLPILYYRSTAAKDACNQRPLKRRYEECLWRTWLVYRRSRFAACFKIRPTRVKTHKNSLVFFVKRLIQKAFHNLRCSIFSSGKSYSTIQHLTYTIKTEFASVNGLLLWKIPPCCAF